MHTRSAFFVIPGMTGVDPEHFAAKKVESTELIAGARLMNVFFYGLFMDQSLLAAKGIKAAVSKKGFVDGYCLRIGERATLIRRPGSRAYGVVMDIAPGEVTELYAEASVADYLPEQVMVELMDGTPLAATCYNLPGDKATGTNREYAESLLQLAASLGFPDAYLEQIRKARH